MENNKSSFYRRGNIIFSLVWIALGVFIAVYDRLNYPMYNAQGLGAGFFPFWLGMVIAAIGAVLLAASIMGKYDAAVGVVPGGAAMLRILLFVVCSIATVFLANVIGMTLAMVLFLFTVLVLIYREPWLYALIVAVIASAAIWLIFDLGFQIHFPTGFLGFI